MTVDNTKVGPSADHAGTGTSGGWLVVETLLEDVEPTLVFDKNKIKECAPIRRRSGFGGHQKTTREIEALVRKVRETSDPADGTHVIEKSGDVVHLEALPIFGPDNVTVFGVQVWVGQGPPTAPPRLIGAMAWHADTKYTYHSRSLELDVMRSPEYVPVRTSHEVFRTYLHFEEQAALGAYTQPVVDGEFDHGAEFFGDITLLDAESTRRRVFLTMRATSDGARGLMRGLVHDVSDYYEPVKQGDRGTIRMVAGVAAETDWCVGHLDLAALIVTEWFVVAEGPLARMAHENFEYVGDSSTKLAGMRDRAIATGKRVSDVLTISFHGETPVQIEAQLQPPLSTEAQTLVHFRLVPESKG